MAHKNIRSTNVFSFSKSKLIYNRDEQQIDYDIQLQTRKKL